MRAEIIVKGIVQGVGFRPFVYRVAKDHDLRGYVRNRGDAGVEIVIEGNEDRARLFIGDIKEKKPALSSIYEIIITYGDEEGFSDFQILESSADGDLAGSVIPYDVAICDNCLRELRDPLNRRHDYFFTTCTDCGPRYTIMNKLPYDRSNTTMRDFAPCSECRAEYDDPRDRRFHSQTVACKNCGPEVYLTDNQGRRVHSPDSIRLAGKLIEEGFIVAVKGNGGFHISASTTNDSPIRRLRRIKHRAQKPFSIMSRDVAAIKTFAHLNETEEELITSVTRPILLLRKRSEYYLSELVSPGLHNVGVMLPYTGLHYMLFDNTVEAALVMTSANPPSEPIITGNEEAFKKLGDMVDYFLLHNRQIAQRCDDSVIRPHEYGKRIIRRSRGYAPTPLHLRQHWRHSALGLGAEENVNTCILHEDKAFISQHIGDVECYETLRFLEETVEHLLRITKTKPSALGCDLHPGFSTTRLAQRLAGPLKCQIFPIQHHYAHCLSLMAENGVNEMIGIVCDGAGFGSDSHTWGGEILYCTGKEFTRLGHLQEQPMPGGDLATRYPLRMTAAILGTSASSKWLLSKADHFPHGKQEVELLLRQINQGQLPPTTSCGRVLDAVSALLGICHERTYEGEPALKLESVAEDGEDILRLEPKIHGTTIDTTYLVECVFENRRKWPIPDLAFSSEEYLARALAELALDQARKSGVYSIGFTGGVAYNEHITRSIMRTLKKSKLNLIVHQEVPPGDGGISFGQAIGASNALKAEQLTERESL